MKPFRLLQLNMQFGQVWDPANPDHAPLDLDRTIAEIKRHDADIIHLQEVEHAKSGAHQPEPPPNYVRLLEALPGYHGFFAYPRPDERELPFGIGLAILSRTPLRDTFSEDLPSPPIEFSFNGCQRTPTDRLLIGATTTIGGLDVALLNTHLLAFFMLNSSSEVHGDQRARIAARLRAAAGPTLLSGDFNVRDHRSLMRQFGEAGFSSVQAETPTWHRRPYVLDHIFHNRPLACVARDVPATTASDHLPVVADFVFA